MIIPFYKLAEKFESDETARTELSLFTKKFFILANIFLYFLAGILTLLTIFGIL